MPEQPAKPSSQPQSAHALLLADAHSSLVALQRSLAGPTSAGPEAALHLVDLASMLSGMSLRAEAQGLKAFAQALVEESASGGPALERLAAGLRALLLAVESGDALSLDAARLSLLASMSSAPLSIPATAPVSAAVGPMGFASPSASTAPSADSPAAPPFAADGDPLHPAEHGLGNGEAPRSRSPEEQSASLSLPLELIESDATPLFSAGLTRGSFAAAASLGTFPVPTPAILPVHPDVSALRSHLLETVQDAASWIHAQDAVHNAVLLKLHATQDSLVQVGQQPVQQVYPGAAGAAACWVDPEVLQLLDHLAIFSVRASDIAVQVRNLTLFVQWNQLFLSQAERQHIGQRLSDAHGRVDLLDTGLQLVMPVSSRRMRMLPCLIEGHWYALPWAQCLEVVPGVSIRLQFGLQPLSLQVAQIRTASNMNLYPWPAVVPAPPGLMGLALDAQGRLHRVRQSWS